MKKALFTCLLFVSTASFGKIKDCKGLDLSVKFSNSKDGSEGESHLLFQAMMELGSSGERDGQIDFHRKSFNWKVDHDDFLHVPIRDLLRLIQGEFRDLDDDEFKSLVKFIDADETRHSVVFKPTKSNNWNTSSGEKKLEFTSRNVEYDTLSIEYIYKKCTI